MNNVLPGWIEGLPSTGGRRDSMSMKRCGTSEETAATIACLASEAQATSPARTFASWRRDARGVIPMKKTALLAFAGLGVIWGSNFIFMKWAAEEITAGQIVLLRAAFFPPVFFYALSQRALRQEHVRYAPSFVVTGAKRGERAGGAALSPKAVNARSPLITPRACRA